MRADADGRRSDGAGYFLLMSVGALGVVYGDIGTSPLYAFREAFHAAGSLAVAEANVLGILSLMFWSLVVVVTLKYLLVVMRADNGGEGGILALTALAAGPARARSSRGWAVVIGLFGAALLYGDGMITPAISVLSAVEGLGVAAPGLEPFVVPLAVLIIVALFVVQRRGTASIGAVFGPVMIVWFVALAVLGAAQIAANPGVLAAVHPAHAVGLITRSPWATFVALGAIFLVVTGSEALYADMGHFGRDPIRLGWFVVVFPALVINYFGQGALLLSTPDAVDNPFFRMSPGWALVPLVVLATAATVIASQALITGAYSLTVQAMQLGYMPRLHVDHTSPREIGQVYVGAVNWALMAACVALVVGFRSSTGLAAAYGMAVTTTMVVTTLLLARVMRRRWNVGPVVTSLAIGVFITVDLLFFGANVLKIPSGGWLPLVVALVVFGLMVTWQSGRERLTRAVHNPDLPIERFIGSIAKHPQRRVPGTAVYLSSIGGETPPALLANLRHNEVLHDTIILVTVRTASSPRVMPVRRAVVHELGGGFWQILLTFGFFEAPDVPSSLENLVIDGFGFDPTDATYFLGKETVIPVAPGRLARLRDRLFAVMHRNTASAASYFGLPPDRVVEFGSHTELAPHSGAAKRGSLE